MRSCGGKLSCWIGAEILIDQWHTWLHILPSLALKLSFSPENRSVCCCFKFIWINSTLTRTKGSIFQTEKLGFVRDECDRAIVKHVLCSSIYLHLVSIYTCPAYLCRNLFIYYLLYTCKRKIFRCGRSNSNKYRMLSISHKYFTPIANVFLFLYRILLYREGVYVAVFTHAHCL